MASICSSNEISSIWSLNDYCCTMVVFNCWNVSGFLFLSFSWKVPEMSSAMTSPVDPVLLIRYAKLEFWGCPSSLIFAFLKNSRPFRCWKFSRKCCFHNFEVKKEEAVLLWKSALVGSRCLFWLSRLSYPDVLREIKLNLKIGVSTLISQHAMFLVLVTLKSFF